MMINLNQGVSRETSLIFCRNYKKGIDILLNL